MLCGSRSLELKAAAACKGQAGCFGWAGLQGQEPRRDILLGWQVFSSGQVPLGHKGHEGSLQSGSHFHTAKPHIKVSFYTLLLVCESLAKSHLQTLKACSFLQQPQHMWCWSSSAQKTAHEPRGLLWCSLPGETAQQRASPATSPCRLHSLKDLVAVFIHCSREAVTLFYLLLRKTHQGQTKNITGRLFPAASGFGCQTEVTPAGKTLLPLTSVWWPRTASTGWVCA